MFDSVNGNALFAKDGIPPLRTAVSTRSAHVTFWKEAYAKLRRLRYIHKATKKPTPSVPSLHNWIVTIRGMEALWTRLKSMGFKYVKLRMVNQDPLENFFGAIRAHGQRFVSPTCWQFDGLFKTLLVNNASSVHSIGANCEQDDGHFLSPFESFVKDSITKMPSPMTIDNNIVLPETPQTYEENTQMGKTTRLYYAGWLARKLLRSLKIASDCSLCKASLMDGNVNSTAYEGIQMREFNKRKPSLAYPNDDFFERGYVRADNFLRREVPKMCFKSKIGAILRERVRNTLDFEWLKCEIHKKKLSNNFCYFAV